MVHEPLSLNLECYIPSNNSQYSWGPVQIRGLKYACSERGWLKCTSVKLQLILVVTLWAAHLKSTTINSFRNTYIHTHACDHTHTQAHKSSPILWPQRREELTLEFPWQVHEKYHIRYDSLIELGKMYRTLLAERTYRSIPSWDESFGRIWQNTVWAFSPPPWHLVIWCRSRPTVSALTSLCSQTS